MPGEYLPPVITRLEMNIDDFVAGVAKAKAALDALQKSKDINVTVDMKKAIAQMQAFQEKTDKATASQKLLSSQLSDTNARLTEQAAALGLANDGISSMSRRLTTAIDRQKSFKNAVADTNGALLRQGAMSGAVALGGGVGRAARGIGGLPPGALHWIIAGTADILAVTIPALIALGSAAAVAADSYMTFYQHIQAVNTATAASNAMFGQTTSSVLGLKGSLAQAQAAVQPSVFGTIGSGMIIASAGAGKLTQAGVQLNQVFQTFAARMAIDFGPNGASRNLTNGLMTHMVSDATGLGQVFGSAGHNVAIFAQQMPGVAELVLKVLAAISQLATTVLSAISGFTLFGHSIIFWGMGLEEALRWSHLLVSGIALIPGVTKDAAMSMSLFKNPIAYIAGMSRTLLSILPALGVALSRSLSAVGMKKAADATGMFTSSLRDGVAGLSNFAAVGIAVAVVALGYLTYKLLTTKSAAQQLTAAMQQTVSAASNSTVVNTIGANVKSIMSASNSAQAAQGQEILNASKYGNNPAYGIGLHFDMAQNNANQQTYNAGLTQQQQDLAKVYAGASQVAQMYGITLPQAMALADLANVKFVNSTNAQGQVNATALMQIKSLMMGYQAMGQSTGVVGSDMAALSIQTGLAGTKVSQLNQAWDEFMTNLTGGVGGLANFVTAMKNIGNVTATTSNNLGTSSSINLGVSQFAKALTSFSSTGSAAWTNFVQVVNGSLQPLADWFRIAGAEGAMSSQQMTNGLLGAMSALVPYAAKSQTAQSILLGMVQQINPSITSWNQLSAAIKNGNLSLSNTANAVSSATQAMGNMSQVAQQLGNVMQSALLTALSSTKIAASGVNRDMTTYLQTLMNGAGASRQAASQYQQVMKDLENLGYSAKQAASLIAMVSGNLAQVHSKTVTLTVNQVGNYIGSGTGVGGTNTYMPPIVGVGPGHAAGTPNAASGWAWVGEKGPELVKFRGGETVVPNHVAMGYANGAGDFSADTHVHVYLDGRKIYQSVQKSSVMAQRRTGAPGLNRRVR